MKSVFFTADEKLLNISRDVVEHIHTKGTVYFGRMVTGEAFISDDGRQEILKAFEPLSVDKIYVLVQILILPEYQNKGLAQQAIKKVESLYPDAEYWRLDTIAQEDKLCHLYSKMGYQKTGEIEHIKDGMDIVFFEKQVVH